MTDVYFLFRSYAIMSCMVTFVQYLNFQILVCLHDIGLATLFLSPNFQILVCLYDIGLMTLLQFPNLQIIVCFRDSGLVTFLQLSNFQILVCLHGIGLAFSHLRRQSSCRVPSFLTPSHFCNHLCIRKICVHRHGT